jgi:hypothetical protein
MRVEIQSPLFSGQDSFKIRNIAGSIALKGRLSAQSPSPNLIIKEYGFAYASPLKGCGDAGAQPKTGGL